MAKGCDYSWARPNLDALRAAGINYACRYLSYDKTGKNLSRNEATALRAKGIAVVSNWEWAERSALGGFSVGAQHAHDAAFQHIACGGPETAPIYFSVDFQVQSADLHAVAGYFDGIRSVLPVTRIGVYGGFYIASSLWSTGRVKWIWQTSAWSGTTRHGSASLYQHQYNINIGGGQVDIDESYGTNYGQWDAPPVIGGELPVNTGGIDLAPPFSNAAVSAAQGASGLDGAISRLNQLMQ